MLFVEPSKTALCLPFFAAQKIFSSCLFSVISFHRVVFLFLLSENCWNAFLPFEIDDKCLSSFNRENVVKNKRIWW
jgi:hypothetical protein